MPGVVIRQRKPWRRKDGVYIYFEDNAGVIVNPKGEMKGAPHPPPASSPPPPTASSPPTHRILPSLTPQTDRKDGQGDNKSCPRGGCCQRVHTHSFAHCSAAHSQN